MNKIGSAERIKDESYYAWKDIPDGPITLDFSQCRNTHEFHAVLQEGFGFPDYYGRNWDALWDLLDDFAMSEETERVVTVKGLENLPDSWGEYAKKAVKIMRRAEKEYPLVQGIPVSTFCFQNRMTGGRHL